jgi:hypothetical protein
MPIPPSDDPAERSGFLLDKSGKKTARFLLKKGCSHGCSRKTFPFFYGFFRCYRNHHSSVFRFAKLLHGNRLRRSLGRDSDSVILGSSPSRAAFDRPTIWGERNWPESVGFFEATFFPGPQFSPLFGVSGAVLDYRFERGRLPPPSGVVRVSDFGVAG